MRYAMAKQGVYASIQGEGALLGEPMTFVRLAGCSIGCPQCDTDYQVASRWSVNDIAEEAARLGNRWAWITGGEPTDRDLRPLADAIRSRGMQIAVATAGTRTIQHGIADWISVSPHTFGRPVQWTGSEVKLVPGLNALDLSQCDPRDYASFPYRYVVPLHNDVQSFVAAKEWVDQHDGWRLGLQAQKLWGLA